MPPHPPPPTTPRTPGRSRYRGIPDEELARLSSQADGQEPFGELVWRHQARVLALAQRLGCDLHAAEDVTQETFVKAFRNAARFDAARPFAPWLFAIARNTAASALRGRREAPADAAGLEATADPRPAPAAGALDAEALWDLARRALSARAFLLLRLRYGEGLAVAEAARAAGVSGVHARVLLHRSRTRLRQILRNSEPLARGNSGLLPAVGWERAP